MSLTIGVTTHTDEQRAMVDAFNSRVTAQVQALRDAEAIPETLTAEAETLSFAKLKKKLDDSNAQIHALKQEAVHLAIERETLLRTIDAAGMERLQSAEKAFAAERKKTEAALRKAGLDAFDNCPHPDALEKKLLISVNESANVRQAQERVREARALMDECRMALATVEAVIVASRQELRDVTVQMLLKV